MSNIADVVKRCLSFEDEQEWFDFKDNWYELDEIGQYILALSNAAVMAGEPFGYLIWGIHNDTHEYTNTKLRYKRDVKNEPIEHYLARNVSPAIFFSFDEDIIDGNRIVVLSIPAARIVPTEFKNIRYIRVGSSKENIKNHPEREAALFRVLNWGLPSLLNTEARFDDLTFDQLLLYFDMKGIKLNKKTFKKNLELLTIDGKYNLLAQLLSDNPRIPIRFAVFSGYDKTSIMYSVREFGEMCLLLVLDKVIDYGDTLNIPQADERERKVERKEVMLFNAQAFKEAVINAFQHNLWVSGTAPMFTAYQDRIEITSIGTLPPHQTKEGFYAGISIPVNAKLTEIFVQLHISEKSGRGVPRIVGEYGENAFKFSNNAITVTLPYKRLDLGGAPQVTPQDIFEERGNTIDDKIVDYCAEAKSAQEILVYLGLKDRKIL
ncbi:MAG: putative DNA binding domain-containing protein [Lachnospiraceae bacterium]|nr:putative DNA binding domain-containing protein [Lachnospiraceae bacterium]